MEKKSRSADPKIAVKKTVKVKKSAKPASPKNRVRARRMSPDSRREQLLACALKVYADKGIGKAGHTDLAEEAGVSVPTTFHYFPTREDLTEAVLEEVKRFLLEDIVAPRFNDPCPAPESIEIMLLSFSHSIDTCPDHIRVWFEWSVSVRDGLWDKYLVFYNHAIKGVRSILERGKQESSIPESLGVDDATRVIIGVAHMIVQMGFSGSSKEAIGHTIHSLTHGYLSNSRYSS
ncbi:MAG: TetR/AcrR family transcriptional regulator [Porticoccaceae bacterium]|nr:TetR/AcrR family transcriptional regulator [Porticoccaceae bacterium]